MRFSTVSLLLLLVCFSPRTMAGCLLADASSVGFGNTDGSGDLAIRRVGSVSVACDGAYRVGLGAGMWAADTRRLSDGAGHFISYRLWQDSGAKHEWGDVGISPVTYPERSLKGRGRGDPTLLPVYGTVSMPDPPPAGEYSDVVQVTLASPPYGPDDQETVNLQLTLRVTGTCRVDSSGVHGFGTWSAGGPEPSGVSLGTLTILCPPGIKYAVGMDAGLHYDGVRRRMSDGKGFVPYVLRAHRSNGGEWGDAGLSAFDAAYVETYPADAVYGRGGGSPKSIDVWGDAETGGVPSGVYTDTVRATVVW